MTPEPLPPRDSPASLPANVPEDIDASTVIVRRLQAHGARQSRYQERGEVARGGMGAILRVWDEDLRRELAMKVVLGSEGKARPDELPPKVLGRFLEEAQVTGQLDHPGIVPVHELGFDENGGVYFTMRLVRGRDLKEVFELVRARDPEWNLTRALWALLKVCEAMAYAHSKGVIHRDLKPANVMVGRFGEVYVMDWGLARVLGQPDRHDLRLKRTDTSFSFVESERRADVSHSADSVLFTMDGDVVGTPAYMAPEQARGEIERLGPRSDVYSVGAMLYHLLGGDMPYLEQGQKASQHMVLRWVLEGPPKPLHEKDPTLPHEVVAICEKAMGREPAERYADMGELADDLRAYLEGRVVRAWRTGAWVEFKKWVQRNRALAGAWLAAGAVALVGLGATVVVEVRGRRVADAARLEAEENERVADRNAAEARRQEELARRERANVLRLSAFQELGDLEREADGLWPAVPAQLLAYEDWLGRARRLLAGLEPAADGQDLGHRRQLAELLARARPAEECERLLAQHPRAPELERARARATALRRADDVRRGRAQPTPWPEPIAADLGGADLNTRAWERVDPQRTRFGGEAEGLALAQAAAERADGIERQNAQDTLAWAFFANGLDDDALAVSRAALDEAPPDVELQFEEYLAKLARAVQRARGAAGARDVAEAERARDELERELLGTRGQRFASDDDAWWAGQLAVLVRQLERFADPELGLVEGIDEEHGWGIERRLRNARSIEERTRSGSRARELWAAAKAAVAAPDGPYHGLALAPQLGLVPLGPDPESGLWEFADVQSGTPPERGADGRLALAPESGVVFVLLPGGEFPLGAQARAPGELGYDPDANLEEGPVRVLELLPFFLSKYELTQGQWRRLTGADPSKYLSGTRKAGREIGELSPLEQVSWNEATRRLARLGWRLPTEAQWEYGARGGTETPWWTGEDVPSLRGAANLSDRTAQRFAAPWSALEDELDDGNLVHAPVGTFEANAFGLHDVIGNVYEWCRDLYGEYPLPVAEGDGERLGGDVALRVVRGGSFVTNAAGARSAKRDTAPPELQNESIGLRPARALER